MLRTLRALSLIVMALPGLPGHTQSPVDPALAALLQAKLDSCRDAYNVPGISATMLLPGDRFWNGATGLANINTSAPMDTFYVFQAASTTKLFTATIIFQLIEDGLLGLDDTLGTYLAPIPNIPGNTRIRYLLNHRSGIGEYLSVPGVFNNWFAYPDSVWPPELVLNTYNAPNDFVQNGGWSYSNTNYVLLGMIIEQITGNTFAQELHDRFVVPLGLDHLYLPPQAPVQDPLVPGWSSFTQTGVYDTDVTPVLADCFASMTFAAGAIVATAGDLARFTRAVMSGELLTPASLSTMRTCTNVTFSDGCNGYGHGTMRYTYAGRSYFGHSGDISGFTQMSIHGLQDSITLTLSINRNNAPRGPIAAAMLAKVHQAMATGLDELASPASVIELFPVPASGTLTLRCSTLHGGDALEILDAAGRTVRHERAASEGMHVLSTQGLVPGSYRLRWISAHGPRQRQFLVQ